MTDVWRRDITFNQYLDVRDHTGQWLPAVVNAVFRDRVHIHFRPSEQQGQVDAASSEADTKGQVWDEWIMKNSSRLALAGTKTTEEALPVAPSEADGVVTGNSGWKLYLHGDETKPTASVTVTGRVGLQNLGNTCYMNSILQCLGHATPLVQFITQTDEKKMQSLINRDNPLGWKGRVADEFIALIKDIWSVGSPFKTPGVTTRSSGYGTQFYSTSGRLGSTLYGGTGDRIIVPFKMKSVISTVSRQFAGAQQHDSSEFLSFLLDGIHEDLNQVKKKPATSTIESNGRPDHIVAAEAWTNHLLRHQSIIVDLFQGQLKSRLVCPEPSCGRESVTFDPFQFLSLPIPPLLDKRMRIAVIQRIPEAERKTHNFSISFHTCAVPSVGKIIDLKRSLAQVLSSTAKDLGGGSFSVESMTCADVWQRRVYHFLSDDFGLSEIRPSDQTYCYIDAVKKETEQKMPFPVQVIQFTNTTSSNWQLYGVPFIMTMDRVAIHSMTNKNVMDHISDSIGYANISTQCGQKARVHVLSGNAQFCLYCGIGSECKGCMMSYDDNLFKLEVGQGVAFALYWETPPGSFSLPKLLKQDQTKDQPKEQETGTTTKSVLTLKDCINEFTKTEVLGETDAWYCSQCKQHRRASKTVNVYKTPEVLIVHLKRFSFTRLWRDKISTFIDFPIDGLDSSEMLSTQDEKESPVKYDLFAVSNHYGGMGGGHYTAYVKNSDGNWYCHDDSRVSRIEKDTIKSAAAYVLFYAKRH